LRGELYKGKHLLFNMVKTRKIIKRISFDIPDLVITEEITRRVVFPKEKKKPKRRKKK